MIAWSLHWSYHVALGRDYRRSSVNLLLGPIVCSPSGNKSASLSHDATMARWGDQVSLLDGVLAPQRRRPRRLAEVVDERSG
jgi:hypothetical protein